MCRLLGVEPGCADTYGQPPPHNNLAPSSEPDFSQISTSGFLSDNTQENNPITPKTGGEGVSLNCTNHNAPSSPSNSGANGVPEVPSQSRELPETPLDSSANGADCSQPQVLYTPMHLPKSKVLALIKQMKSQKMTQTKIIETLWWVTKSGTNPKWKQAREEYRVLTGE